jgi:hypothetical protein
MTGTRCVHDREICYDCAVVSDAAKRASDIVTAYAVFVPYDELIGKWVAIRLADGGHDGTLYDSKRDAIRHQLDEYHCAYFSYRNAPAGMKAKEAQVWLDYHRAAYDRGFRVPDPDDQCGGPEIIMPVTNEQFYGQLARLQVPGPGR